MKRWKLKIMIKMFSDGFSCSSVMGLNSLIKSDTSFQDALNEKTPLDLFKKTITKRTEKFDLRFYTLKSRKIKRKN